MATSPALSVGGRLVTERIIGASTLQEGTGIELPAALFQRLGGQLTSVGMFFGVYEMAPLFPTGEAASTSRKTELYTQVLAATVGQNVTIQNLKSRVTISFKPQNIEGRVSYAVLKIRREFSEM